MQHLKLWALWDVDDDGDDDDDEEEGWRVLDFMYSDRPYMKNVIGSMYVSHITMDGFRM